MTPIDDTLATALLVYARPLLHADLSGGPAPAVTLPDLAPGGLFVTIYDGRGEVRGSRGTSAPAAALAELAPALIRGAAFDDPRFPPLRADELEQCRLAVTLLGPGRRIAGPGEIEPGVTALRVSAGLFSGTTLPEVAWGRGWDAATYLAFACRKAGLHALAWKAPETEVIAFETWRAAESF